ncbi:hypothetical protein AERO8C_140068 [Aeromonas veronii]|uniref:Uncharacterized protein n=1 Tax=Aeromonas veronii TaxID=654 RepID=A0A653KUT7_AERVE|nr:hypothetical protein AERO8C_140068 [Aeromonas veronii]
MAWISLAISSLCWTTLWVVSSMSLMASSRPCLLMAIITIISRLASSKGIKTWTRIDRLFNDINGSNPELEEPTSYTCTSGAVTGFYC